MDEVNFTTEDGQEKRAADFIAAFERLSSDGHFDSKSGVSVGELISIEHGGKSRVAKVFYSEFLENDLVRTFFRWID